MSPTVFPSRPVCRGLENSQGGKEAQIVGRPYQKSETGALDDLSPERSRMIGAGR